METKLRFIDGEWQDLLSSNKGNKIFFDIYVKDAERGWKKFQSISNTIAKDDIGPEKETLIKKGDVGVCVN